ncbi:MAG: serine/threonine protein kinase [Planctomycetaceae bacterium]|nr:serine/threonine protein kinase [Planctomycetaceae bacterium]
MPTQQIDILCDEFEAALRRGDTVRIEDVLLQVEESQRNALLEELLEIKIQFAVGTQQSEDYIRSMMGSLKKRFPDQQNLIQSLYRQSAQLKQVGDYEILGELGRGGMGTVYKAKHKLLQQTVAVKVLSEALLDDAQAVGRFKREMQLIGSLTHPNIVRALNAGEADGVHYLAMEFVDGITLQKLVENVRTKNDENESARAAGRKPAGSLPKESSNTEPGGLRPPALAPIIPLGAACEMIRQAALGLQNAHELKLVHRDIKPANLMLDHRGTVKLLDLGLGKFAEECRQDYNSSLTMAGMVIGTVDYISPEQCENSGTADVRSDLYSLGCTLYFLLTGKPVYSGSRYDTMRKKLMAHIVGEVPSLRQTIPGLPLAIEAIVQKVLSKDPADRFQTPLEFAEALEPFASPDELWTLMQEVLPMDATDSRSSMRHSSPYGYVQSSRQNIIPPPVSRVKRVAFFVGLNFLIVGLILGAVLLYLHPWAEKQKIAIAHFGAAKSLLNEWRIAEARECARKAVGIFAEVYLGKREPIVRERLLKSQIVSAELRWYHGEVSGARRDLQSVLEEIDRAISENPSNKEFHLLKLHVQERLGDIRLFSGAASGLNTERGSMGRTEWFREALKTGGGGTSRSNVIQWKQAITSALNGDLEEAHILRINTTYDSSLSVADDSYYTLTSQLAEAVLHYYQPGGGASRTQKLRVFRGQFFSQDNPARGATAQPEVIELLLFCAEFLIHDSVTHKDWETLGSDITTMRRDTADFLRTRPGALPFVRRFYELLVQSAALVYENAERPQDKRAAIDDIFQILERMRPLKREPGAVGSAVGTERPTVVLFFLPEATATQSNIRMSEPGFVVFYPQDNRPGTLYRLPLTRQMVKQPVPGRTPPSLSAELLAKIDAEKAAGRRIRVSWMDTAARANAADALSEAEYPYGEVLPLR